MLYLFILKNENKEPYDNLKIFSNSIATLDLMDKMNHNLTCVKIPLPSADVCFTENIPIGSDCSGQFLEITHNRMKQLNCQNEYIC